MIPESEIVDQWTVICDCITKPDESRQALELLTTEMFTERGCRDVFDVFRQLHADGLPTDINHVIERLEQNGKLTQPVGLKLHAAACDARAPQPVAYYAHRVREHYRKRCAREILQRHYESLQNGHSCDDAIDSLTAELSRLQVHAATSRTRRRRDANSGFQPFPMHALPDVMRTFARTAASSIGCDPDRKSVV